MNKVILMGRLTKDPEVKYSQKNEPMAIARYTLAVDRRFKKDGEEQTADFFRCISFAQTAEFAEKYYHKGIKIIISGRIQTGSYTNKDGIKVYTTDIVVEEQDFAGAKDYAQSNNNAASDVDINGFMNIPDDIDSELPFH
ncbi:MAG: single-stranded DNA-binding protein [Lachnospiraceae bacterium]